MNHDPVTIMLMIGAILIVCFTLGIAWFFEIFPPKRKQPKAHQDDNLVAPVRKDLVEALNEVRARKDRDVIFEEYTEEIVAWMALKVPRETIVIHRIAPSTYTIMCYLEDGHKNFIVCSRQDTSGYKQMLTKAGEIVLHWEVKDTDEWVRAKKTAIAGMPK